jgi:hypothetical protein
MRPNGNASDKADEGDVTDHAKQIRLAPIVSYDGDNISCAGDSFDNRAKIEKAVKASNASN